jgi:hypothetical protein
MLLCLWEEVKGRTTSWKFPTKIRRICIMGRQNIAKLPVEIVHRRWSNMRALTQQFFLDSSLCRQHCYYILYSLAGSNSALVSDGCNTKVARSHKMLAKVASLTWVYWGMKEFTDSKSVNSPQQSFDS